MKTQKEEILQYLKKHKTITSWDAIEMFHVTRLAAVIFLLKQDGHEIFTEIVTKDNKKFAKYRLIKEFKHD